MINLLNILIPILLLSCGVEVGNPKQPDPQPKAMQTLEESDLALVAGDNINDIITAVSTLNNTQNQTISLQFMQSEVDASCERGIDQTLVSRSAKVDRQVERGTSANQRSIKTHIEVQSLMSYSASELPIQCRDDNRVSIPWQGINSLTIQQNYSSIKSREVSKVSNQEILVSSKLVLQGNHEVSLTKESLAEGSIGLLETHKFKIEKVVSIQTQAATKEFSLTWENDPQYPYIIYKTRSAEGISSLTIRSGIISQTISEQETLTLDYKALALDPSTCAPLSGSVEIVHIRSDEPDNSRSYSIRVLDGELIFTSQDGLIIPIDLEPCSLF